MKPSLRKEVKDRDRGCRGCGGITQSEVHHIKFRSQGGKDKADNLIWLCGDCHRSAHNTGRGYIAAWELSLVLHMNIQTVTVMRKRELDRVCGGCEYRTERNECMVWDHDVDWDYTCDVWTRRNRRMYEREER